MPDACWRACGDGLVALPGIPERLGSGNRGRIVFPYLRSLAVPCNHTAPAYKPETPLRNPIDPFKEPFK